MAGLNEFLKSLFISSHVDDYSTIIVLCFLYFYQSLAHIFRNASEKLNDITSLLICNIFASPWGVPGLKRTSRDRQ